MMLSRTKNFFLALLTIIGTIIGVGMFGLPYVLSRVGPVVMAVSIVLVGGIATFLHLIYGEVVLRTEGKHRLVGYAEIYFGSIGKAVASIIFLGALFLALFSYLLVGSRFLEIIFSGWLNWSVDAWVLAIAAFGFLVIFKGFKIAGFVESFMTFALVILILGLTVYGYDRINGSDMSFASMNIDWFLPYGVLLFALAGGSAVPEARAFFTGGSAKFFKKAIILGTAIPAIIYFIFSATVVGISGGATSKEAISGLVPFLGNDIARYGAVVGFFAVITSFLTIGMAVKNSLIFDFKFSRPVSFALTAFIPLAMYFYGFSDFIKVFSISGAVLGGCEGLLLLAIWSKAKRKGRRIPEYSINLNKVMVLFLSLAFLAGIVYEIVYVF